MKVNITIINKIVLTFEIESYKSDEFLFGKFEV